MKPAEAVPKIAKADTQAEFASALGTAVFLHGPSAGSNRGDDSDAYPAATRRLLGSLGMESSQRRSVIRMTHCDFQVASLGGRTCSCRRLTPGRGGRRLNRVLPVGAIPGEDLALALFPRQSFRVDFARSHLRLGRGLSARILLCGNANKCRLGSVGSSSSVSLDLRMESPT
jgi:hypothetical protein